jgi:integrase
MVRRLTDLRFIHAFVDRTGRARFYFRRSGKRTVLPGLPGSREFMDAYAACLAQQEPPRERRAAPAAGTLAALGVLYYGSPQFLKLSPTSRGNYRRVIDRFLVEHGHRRVDQMKREHVDIIIGRLADTPGAAITLLKRIRTLMRYAMALHWIDRDPTFGVKSFTSKEIHTWTESEIAQFEDRWQKGTRERLAFVLLLYTGQRGCDVHRMTWPDIAGDAIRVVQQKTGIKMVASSRSAGRVVACQAQSPEHLDNGVPSTVLSQGLRKHDFSGDRQSGPPAAMQGTRAPQSRGATTCRSWLHRERDRRNHRA